MIKFALACAAGHAFESWFSDGAAYDTQVKRGFVQCPVCGSKQVGKAIMAPRVVTRRATPPAAAMPAPEAPATPPGAPAAPTAAPVALLDDKARELRAMIREVRVRMMAEAEDVGSRFATEARRIHDGAATERPIYGQATLADAQALLEDGIGLLPIPGLPDEHN